MTSPVEMTDDEQFMNELLMAAGFDPEEDDFELLKLDLEPILAERVMLKVYDALPTDADRARFDEFMDEANPFSEEEFMKFLQSKIPDFDEFMAQVHLEFQEEYLEVMKEV